MCPFYFGTRLCILSIPICVNRFTLSFVQFYCIIGYTNANIGPQWVGTWLNILSGINYSNTTFDQKRWYVRENFRITSCRFSLRSSVWALVSFVDLPCLETTEALRCSWLTTENEILRNWSKQTRLLPSLSNILIQYKQSVHSYMVLSISI